MTSFFIDIAAISIFAVMGIISPVNQTPVPETNQIHGPAPTPARQEVFTNPIFEQAKRGNTPN